MRWLWLVLVVGCGESGSGEATPDMAQSADFEFAPDAGTDAETEQDAQVVDAGSDVPDAAVELSDPRFLSLPPTVAGPLWGYLVADVGDGTAYVFGGTNANAGGGDVLDVLRRLDANLELPSFVPVETPVGPAARYCGCAAWDPVRERAIVSGGRDFREFFDDTWVFDPADSSWRQTEGEAHPSGVLGCAMVYVPSADAFLAFGGAAMSGSNAETWWLDAETLVWRQVDSEGPRARYDAELLELPNGQVLMLGGGGSAAGPFFEDVWRFDPDAESWTQIETDGARPNGRRIPWIVVESPSTVLYGFGNAGMSPDEHFADLWRLDWVEGTWTELEIEGPQRRGFARWLPGGEGSLGLLLGGFDGRVPLSDQWVLMRR